MSQEGWEAPQLYIRRCNHTQGSLCPCDEERGEVAKEMSGRHGSSVPDGCFKKDWTEKGRASRRQG